MVASPISLRLPREVAEKVRRIAALEHRSFAETVRILTEEAIKMREFPDMVFVDGPTGRRARFRDGLDVWEVIEPYLAAGKDWTILKASYPEEHESKLLAAVRYYESYPEEVEARVSLNRNG